MFFKVGLYLKKLHESKGVNFFMNASMVELQGDGAVERAVLKDGSVLDVSFDGVCSTIPALIVKSYLTLYFLQCACAN